MRITGGRLRNRKIQVPQGQSVRPSSGVLRETLFNVCQAQVEGAVFLDLFAGSGAVGIEALSRGAATCTFVEQDRNVLKFLHTNLEQFELGDSARVVARDVLLAIKMLAKNPRKFDLIFLDPPYLQVGEPGESLSSQVLLALDESSILHEDCIIFAEDSSLAASLEPELKKLELTRTRRMGRSVLRQYSFKNTPS